MDGKPTHVPLGRHAGKARNCLPKFVASPLPPAPPPSGKDSAFGDGGGVASERGACSFRCPRPRPQERGAGRQRVLHSRAAAPGALTCRSRSSRRCAASGPTRDAICIPPPARRLAGASVARRGSVFLAVTLIRCRVGTCTESGWARASPVRVHFLLEKLRAPCAALPHAPPPRSCRLRGGGRRARSLSPRERGRRRRGEAAGPGPRKSSPGFASSSERGASARPASRGLVSICPSRLRVKFAGGNPVIRAEPLGGEPPFPMLTDGKSDRVGQGGLPATVPAAAAAARAGGGWAPRQETAKGGATRAACPFPGWKTWILGEIGQVWSDSCPSKHRLPWSFPARSLFF